MTVGRLTIPSMIRGAKEILKMAGKDSKKVSEVVFHLRDINAAMTKAWEKEFSSYRNTVKV